MSDRIRLDYGSGTVQSDHQPHNHHRLLPPSIVSCPAVLPSPFGDNRGIRHYAFGPAPALLQLQFSVFSLQSSRVTVFSTISATFMSSSTPVFLTNRSDYHSLVLFRHIRQQLIAAQTRAVEIFCSD